MEEGGKEFAQKGAKRAKDVMKKKGGKSKEI
jgi:hypothetical protein